MRSMDRTYLASLGFADADRNSQLHDNTCLYLQPIWIAQIDVEFFMENALIQSEEESF